MRVTLEISTTLLGLHTFRNVHLVSHIWEKQQCSILPDEGQAPVTREF